MQPVCVHFNEFWYIYILMSPPLQIKHKTFLSPRISHVSHPFNPFLTTGLRRLCLLFSKVIIFPRISYNWNHTVWYKPFSANLISFIVTFLRFIMMFISVTYTFFYWWIILHFMYVPQSICYLLVTLGCFHFGAIMNKTAVNI